VVRGLRPKLAKAVGMKTFVQNVPTIRIGSLSKSPYQYVIQRPHTQPLSQWAPRIEQKLRSLPSIVDVSTDLQIARPQVNVEINREKAAALRVSSQALEHTLGLVLA